MSFRQFGFFSNYLQYIGPGGDRGESVARLFLSERTNSENEHNSISRLDPPPLFIYP